MRFPYPPVRTDNNAFAIDTMIRRVPAILQEVLDRNPDYSPASQAAVRQLSAEIAGDAPIRQPEAHYVDEFGWGEAFRQHAGQTWLHTDWFFAETAYYWLLMEAVRWWETGRDPFAPWKHDELADGQPWALLERALALREEAAEARLNGLLHAGVWGNRIDLSFPDSRERGLHADADDLLCDDSAVCAAHLLRASGPVHIVADNFGTELAADFALADALLEQGTPQVVFHLKVHPMFISDALPTDAFTLLHAIEAAPSAAVRALGGRLMAAFEARRLRLSADPFWCGCQPLWEAPPRLREAFKGARLVIFKGDLNYRRVVGDLLCPPETPVAELTAGFPAPLLLLRTLKSDLLAGLRPGLAAALDAVDARWRNNGQRGVIQFVASP